MVHAAPRIAAVPAVLALVVLAFWLGGGVISDDFRVSMVLTAALVGAVGAGIWLLTRSRRQLRLPALGTYVVASAAIGGYLAWASVRDVEVNEKVVTGVPAVQREQQKPAGNVQVQSGGFASLAHPTDGRAAVVELAGGGRRLTLTRFETSPGPDLRVRLAAGNPSDGGASDFKDVGALKGNRGSQQYSIDGIDTERYSTVVIWCRAFSVGFGQARLDAT